MSQIKIKILKQSSIQTKNVLSCSFFVMNHAYKNADSYTNFLSLLIHRTPQKLPDFELRIYTDDSGKDIVLGLAKNHSHVSVYEYYCQPFRNRNGGNAGHVGNVGHVGTFGTLVRFLPLFEQGLHTVWITDIDIAENILDSSIISTMKKHKRDFFVNNFLCYERKPWNKHAQFPIVAFKIISFITFPKKILTQFINKLSKGDFRQEIEEMNKFNEDKTPNALFPYGTDEFFINTFLYSYLKTHKIRVYLVIYHSVLKFIKYGIADISRKEVEIIDRFIRTPKIWDFAKIKKIVRNRIPELSNKLPCLNRVVEQLDNFEFPAKIGWAFEEPLPQITYL